jgi:hypothetical protein
MLLTRLKKHWILPVLAVALVAILAAWRLAPVQAQEGEKPPLGDLKEESFAAVMKRMVATAESSISERYSGMCPRRSEASAAGP